MEKAKRAQSSKVSKLAKKKKVKENFVRIDIKKKSFASKGYKKLNVQKYKRKKYKKLQKDKKDCCFKCGENGHWAVNCPKNAEEIAEQLEAELEVDVNEVSDKPIDSDAELVYEIPVSHRILVDEQDDDDSDEFHKDDQGFDEFF